MKDDITDSGRELIRQWDASRRRLNFLWHDMERAEASVNETATTLGAWMCPRDAKVGETFHIWCAGGMIAATKKDNNVYAIVWREKPKD